MWIQMEIEMPLVYIIIPTAAIILNSVIVYRSPGTRNIYNSWLVIPGGYVYYDLYGNVFDSYGIFWLSVYH